MQRMREELVKSVVMLTRGITVAAQRYTDEVCRQVHLHSTDLTALAHLSDAELSGRTMSQTELGRMLGLTGPAITALADRLERAGYLVKTRSLTDRRKMELGLTGAARQMSTRMYLPIRMNVADHLDVCTEEELRSSIKVLKALLRGTDHAADELIEPGEDQAADR